MKTMQVSQFKASCLAALKEVQQTRQPLLVTLRGKPLAVVRAADAPRPGKRLGRLKGRMTIRRDLVRVDSSRDWEMLR